MVSVAFMLPEEMRNLFAINFVTWKKLFELNRLCKDILNRELSGVDCPLMLSDSSLMLH